MKLSSSGLTHVGMKRTHNEDCLRIYRDEGLFIVADGMGGHASGEVASEMSVEALARFYTASALDEELTWPYKEDYTESYQENRIRIGVQLSNRKIYESAVYDPKLKGMGTTMVATAFYDDKFSIGHVGDSRVYLFRKGALRQVTEDHSLLNDYIKMRGGMTPEEIQAFPHKNVIVRALGMKESVQVDVITEPVEQGDLMLLCSDGLSGMLTDEEMSDLISHAVSEAGDIGGVDLDDLCVSLINSANRNGGNDNITVVLVRCDSLSDGPLEVSSGAAVTQPAWGATVNEIIEEDTAELTQESVSVKAEEEPEADPLEETSELRSPASMFSELRTSDAQEPVKEAREEPTDEPTLRGGFDPELIMSPRSGATPSPLTPPSSSEEPQEEPQEKPQEEPQEDGAATLVVKPKVEREVEPTLKGAPMSNPFASLAQRSSLTPLGGRLASQREEPQEGEPQEGEPQEEQRGAPSEEEATLNERPSTLHGLPSLEEQLSDELGEQTLRVEPGATLLGPPQASFTADQIGEQGAEGTGEGTGEGAGEGEEPHQG